MSGIIIFDVNETLLDLSALDPPFQMNFGTSEVRKEWFAEVLREAFVTTIIGTYSDFGAIGRSALLVIEERHKMHFSEERLTNSFGHAPFAAPFGCDSGLREVTQGRLAPGGTHQFHTRNR